MHSNYLRFIASVLIAAVFLWLALKDISFQDLRLTMNNLTYYWLLPYLLVSLFSHYLRAERWRQLIEQEGVRTRRMTLFSGVMIGYMVNYAVPRLGEVSRSIFVGNKEHISRSRLVGTVVLERALDLLVMLVLAIIVLVYLLADFRVIVSLLGSRTVQGLQSMLTLDGALTLALLGLAALAILYLSYRLLVFFSQHLPVLDKMRSLVADSSKKFLQGILSIRHVKNWPLFILLTAAIWSCYVLMTYIPFTAFDMHTAYGLGMREALVITVVSALGVSLPSPGGIGTYHWFVSRSLLLLFAVPETVGVAYAIVTHLVMMIIILVATPLLLLINKTVWNPGRTWD
ncbi:MAG: lysylphosphatidylglycerol synthase transmembrane domain-containing protein [Cyclonatronaceae bacterium]